MTVGFPDWGRQTHPAGVLKASLNVVVAHGVNQSTPVVFVGDYSYINLTVNANLLASFYEVIVSWFTDSTGGTAVTTGSLSIPPTSQSSLQIPVVTPWVSFTIVNLTVTVDPAILLYAYATLARSPDVRARDLAIPFLEWHGSIAAAGTQQVFSLATAAGPAVLYGRHTANNLWSVLLNYWRYTDQTWQPLVSITGSTVGTEDCRTIALPAAPIRMDVTNSDTVARTTHATVVLAAA